MNTHHPFRRTGLARLAFSLIEVLVVIALLSLIIIGLVAMFGQTQRAFKLGATQVDVLESGRAVTDMLTRELSQMEASRQSPASGAANFYALLRNYSPLLQALPGTAGTGRTNLLFEMFFLTRENQTWRGVGYFVRTNNSQYLGFPGAGVGTLYRFETNYSDAVFKQNPGGFWSDFSASLTNAAHATKIMDGVVHFKVRAYDTNNYWINRDIGSSISNTWSVSVPDEKGWSAFYSNAVPASVELELGILEERAAERARSISDPTAKANFLAQQAGKLHLFRWRVPVRNVDPTAY